MRAAARIRKTSEVALVKGADLAGHAVRSVPALIGTGCVAWGLAEIYSPLGWITAGVALILIDKKVP